MSLHHPLGCQKLGSSLLTSLTPHLQKALDFIPPPFHPYKWQDRVQTAPRNQIGVLCSEGKTDNYEDFKRKKWYHMYWRRKVVEVCVKLWHRCDVRVPALVRYQIEFDEEYVASELDGFFPFSQLQNVNHQSSAPVTHPEVTGVKKAWTATPGQAVSPLSGCEEWSLPPPTLQLICSAWDFISYITIFIHYHYSYWLISY